MNPFTQRNIETVESTELLQQYSIVEADALIEIGIAVISVAFSLDEYLSQINNFYVPKIC
jgi:hypothetical protein